MRECWAIIPARGGSKGIPRKNLQDLGGVPLVAHTIHAARECPAVTSAFVSTDDPEIASVSRKYGANVIDRPVEISGDEVPTEAVVRHVLDVALARQGSTPEVVVVLQPTSPFRTADHIGECLVALEREGAEAAVSVVAAEHHPYRSVRICGGWLHPFFDGGLLTRPRQQLPQAWRHNGAIYCVRTEVFLRTGCLFTDRTAPYLMRPEDSVDIDTAFELECARALLSSTALSLDLLDSSRVASSLDVPRDASP